MAGTVFGVVIVAGRVVGVVVVEGTVVRILVVGKGVVVTGVVVPDVVVPPWDPPRCSHHPWVPRAVPPWNVLSVSPPISKAATAALHPTALCPLPHGEGGKEMWMNLRADI